jgi:hypothetical protein
MRRSAVWQTFALVEPAFDQANPKAGIAHIALHSRRFVVTQSYFANAARSTASKSVNRKWS